VKTLLRIFLAAGVFLSFASSGLADKSPDLTVVEIKVEGNKTTSRNAVLSYIKIREGMPYSEDAVRADRDRLMQSGRFDAADVKSTVTDKGVVLTFVVSERPEISRLMIEGNRHFSEEELLKDIPFAQGDPLNPANIEQGKLALLNKYRGEGYYLADVKVNRVMKDGGYQVIYSIEEGPQSIITKVRFDGNHYFSKASLIMRTQTKAKLFPFIKGYLNMEKIDRDIISIRNAYVQEGFLDAEVGRELEFSADKSKVTVVFKINEGPRYRVNEIIFKGNKVYSGEQLLEQIKFHRESFFTGETLQIDVKSIKAAYGEIGYIDADIIAHKQFISPDSPAPEWARNIDGGSPALLNLIFEIDEKDRYQIGAIRIQGNDVTQERVIRRELRFYPEERCDTVAIERSKVRLQELQIFKSVEIKPVSVPDPGNPDKFIPGVKDIVVEVEEGKSSNFIAGVGVSTNNGLLGTVSLTYRNFNIMDWPKTWADFIKARSFKGAGQTFQLTAEPGTELMRFTASWFTPYIFDQPYSVGTKAYYFTRDYDRYDVRRLGLQTSLGHTFKNRWAGEVSVNYENVNEDADSDACQEIWDDRGDYNFVRFRGALVRDRTDSRWDPSTGDRFSFSYEQTAGTATFGKFDANYRIYRTLYVDPLDRKHILSGRIAYGQMVGDDIPVFEKYYGGGIGSIRGFEYRGISPRGHYRGTDIIKKNDPIGGDMMFYAGSEYTFPLIGENLRGVLFIDSGTVEESCSFTNYRISIGAGLRIKIPFMGPVPMALDFGIPVMKAEYDDTQILSFSVGWSF